MKAIGIDLGTTNSVICEYSRGDRKILNIEGSQTVPSVIYINNGETIVGKSAKNRLLINSSQCLSSTKRNMGSDWEKEIEGTKYSAVDAARIILMYLKEQAEDIDDVVITIPAYFEENQREQTMEAAKQAGFNVLRLLPEPTAAAISYGLNKEKDQTILVVDLGGGTFDVSILEVINNDFTVKAVDGNHQLGGDDFDLAIVKFLNDHIKEQFGKSLEKDPVAQQKLKEEAERVKIALATAKSESIFISELVPSISIEIDKFTRDQFKELIQGHLDEIVSKTNDVINQANLTKEDINRFVLVGGSCKHPLVQEVIEVHFRKPYLSDNMDTCVAEGAAILCNNLMTPTNDGSTKDIFPTAGPDGNNQLTTEEVVIKDAVSHSLGIDMVDSINDLFFAPIIPRNTNYPCKSAIIGYSDGSLMQEKVIMSVFRGEDNNPNNNTYLGVLNNKVPRKYIGEVQMAYVAVFELDENGILTFKSIEIPLTMDNRSLIKQLTSDRKEDEMTVPWELAYELAEKHGFAIKETKIETK
ncbi:Hsp70 family protein [Aureisphaera galaxeae]|uniref:Hsp70 family protein n=1 Tax=Aureisphaera galaxeae TaxID=1538023 RepID=UPI00234FC3F8|nr:Hsp70 family protein [Aureisphaera galaxeae]MDC8003093.1 Hsp70 family protein [Aureisphaera galaxeae]